MGWIPEREDLLDYDKIELVDLANDLIEKLKNKSPEGLEEIFPDDDEE